MDPSSSSSSSNCECEDIGEREVGMNISSSVAVEAATTALDNEDSRDGVTNTQEEFTETKDPSSSPSPSSSSSPSPSPSPSSSPSPSPPPPPSSSSSQSEEESDSDTSSTSTDSSSSDSEDDQHFDAEATEDQLEMGLVTFAMVGDSSIFKELKFIRLQNKKLLKVNMTNTHFCIKSFEENNLLHIAIRSKQTKFVRKFLEKCPLVSNKNVITDRNSQGNTPLHVAAQVGKKYIVQLLYNYLKKSHGDDDDDDDDDKPWRAQNSQGNTALHLAILCNHAKVALFLVEQDPGLARIVNNSKEAPLHLAITYGPFDPLDKIDRVTTVLLEKARCVAGWPDAKGLTPLLRAASLHPSNILPTTWTILRACLESTLVCDPFGQSFLHLLMLNNKLFDMHRKQLDTEFNCEEFKRLLLFPAIRILLDHQDQDGNTPLHIASKCENIFMVRSLRDESNIYIKNNDGISADSMMRNIHFSRDEPEEPEETRSVTEETFDRDFAWWLLRFLDLEMELYWKKDLLDRKDSDGNNILHLLMNIRRATHYYSSDSVNCLKYSRRVLEHDPKLVCQRNGNQDTPIHILAKNKNLCTFMADQGLLSRLLSAFAQAITRIDDKADSSDQPWVMTDNVICHTPLHAAIKANNRNLVLELLPYSNGAALTVDAKKNTPLHLLATQIEGIKEFTNEELMEIVCANIEALVLPNKKGLTPILGALEAENVQMVVAILHIVKKFSDNGGQQFWHHVLNHDESKNFVKDFLLNEAFRNMLQLKDEDGNTLFHVAMKEGCFEFVEDILETWERERSLIEGEDSDERSLIEGEDSEERSLIEGEGSEEPAESNQWLIDLIEILDKDGLTSIICALKAGNSNLAARLCHLNPEAAKLGDINGKTILHLLSEPPSYKSQIVKELLKSEALRKILEQIDEDGNTPLHLAIKGKCFGFVHDVLEIWESEGESSERKQSQGYQWQLDPLKKLDNNDLTPIIRARNVSSNPNLATRLCNLYLKAAKMGDKIGKTIWHLLSKPPSHKTQIVKELFENEASRKVLEQIDNDGNTLLHLARFGFGQDVLEARGSEGESLKRNQSQNDQWLMDPLKKLDNDGLTPIIRALNAGNPDLAVRLCHVNPEAAKIGDINGKTIWHLLSTPPSYKSKNVKELLETKALRKILEQKDNKDGNTALHLAIKEKCFGFVQDLLEASEESEHEFSEGDPWPTGLLRAPNNISETPEDLLADLPTLSHGLEEKLLTDRRMIGIRSSWRIPRTQLQNYMNSINVIASLQTTITFTAAFTVPGGLIQDKGFPILIPSIAFQVFLISDVIAMCLSMMVLICPFWMVSGTKRKSVEIQDFTLSLLQASFIATLLTFMSGVFATIYPVKPWIAMTTVVLCSLLVLLLHKFIITELLLPSKRAAVHFVQQLWDSTAAVCSTAIKNTRLNNESEHTRLNNPDRSPNEPNIV